MPMTSYERQSLLNSAASQLGLSLVHQSGPAKGKPLGRRRVSAILSTFIKAQKGVGALIEQRPQDPFSGRRRARFIFIPQNLDLFAVNRGSDPNLT